MHSSGRADSSEFGRCTGLLFLLKRKLFQDPRLLEVNPGRLALVQAVHRETQLTVSLIGVYQHVWRSGLTTARNRELRQLIWTQLDQTLQRVPSRHCLAVCGDFNTTLQPETAMVGSAVPQGTTNADDGLQALLHKHSLSALNTWHCRPHTTFHSHTGDTQIDYVITRQDNAHAQARTAYPDHHFPVGGYRLSQHFPVRASLPLRLFSHRRSPPSAHPTFDSSALQAAVREHTPLAQELQQRIALRLREVCTVQLAGVHQHVNRILLEETSALFPPSPPADHRVSAHPTYRITARAVWHIYRCLKHPGVCTSLRSGDWPHSLPEPHAHSADAVRTSRDNTSSPRWKKRNQQLPREISEDCTSLFEGCLPALASSQADCVMRMAASSPETKNSRPLFSMAMLPLLPSLTITRFCHFRGCHRHCFIHCHRACPPRHCQGCTQTHSASCYLEALRHCSGRGPRPSTHRSPPRRHDCRP